ncbi:MAG: YpdA family putative bacillithiol disulfide reductase [Vicinamibacterales bacterium]
MHDLVIVGAGPAGLATAIEAGRRGLSRVVLERGVLVNTLLRYPTNMVFFTTPELLEIGDLPFVTPHEKPNRFEALRYYRRVCDHFELPVESGQDVRRVRRGDDDSLAVESVDGEGALREWPARFVVVAVGGFDHANRLGVPGEDLPHVSHYYSESHPYYRQRVVVVGGKNSAAEAALDLYRNGARVTLVHRGESLGDSIKYWVRPDIENRLKEGSIAAYFRSTVTAIRRGSVTVATAEGPRELEADAVLLLTGYHVDTGFFERSGLAYDPSSYAPAVDADSLEASVPGVFVVGSAIMGRQGGPIFIENGRFHGQRVVAEIARRLSRA